MTVYENASIYIDRQGFVKNSDGGLETYTIDVESPKDIDRIQQMANTTGNTVYIIREFVAVDADYQDHHPKKCAKDWFVLEVKPSI